KCHAAFALVEPQALRDERNFLFRRQLGWSHLCIGDVQMAQSNRRGGLESYRKGAQMLETLAELDSKSALRKSDLAWAYNKMGNAVLAQGRREEATESL